ncbi:MAG: hypothetical protein SGJ19_25395 [Planctomycetia bacterium]|nr:hypothetical protein [Planctomycetia bacterium]
MATATTIQASATDTPTRAVLLDKVIDAEQIVQDLLDAGLPRDRITVVSDAAEIRRRFSSVDTQPPAGRLTVKWIAIGSIAGLVLGGVMAIALGAMNSDDQPRMLMGALIPLAAALVGGFVGAMMTRGTESEPANFHDQAALPDKTLVAVELQPEDPITWITLAERVMRRHGAEPLPLARG